MYCSRCGTWVPAEAVACAACGLPRSEAPPAAPVREPAEALFVPPPAHRGVRYAGFWRRLAAMFVDGLVLFFPNAILRMLAGLPTPLSLHPLRDDLFGRALAVTATLTLIYWWYSARLESSRWQGTLGQQLLGLKVTDLHGRRISFLRATGRFFASSLSVLLCGFGYAFNLWTSRRQTLHDLVAGCVFVRPDPMVEPQTETPQAEPAS